MRPAKEIQAIYGHINRDANGAVSLIRKTYHREKTTIPMIINNDMRYFSELNTEGHAKLSANWMMKHTTIRLNCCKSSFLLRIDMKLIAIVV